MITPIFNLHDIVLILTIVVSFALALFQPMIPVKNPITRILLACFFLSLTISNMGIMLIWNEYIHNSALVSTLLPYFYAAALLAKGPALYLYVQSITEEKFTLKPVYLLHLVSILAVLPLIAFFAIDIDDLRLTRIGMNPALITAVNSVWYTLKIIPLVYFMAATFSIFRYHRRLKQQYSNLNESAVTWLYFLTIGFALASVWTLMVSVLGYLYRLPYGITDNYFSFILLLALFYYSVTHAKDLKTTTDEREVTAIEAKPLDSIIRKIVAGIEEERLFLNQALNIDQFSRKIGVSSREVSYAINKSFGKNFFEFINSYRVEESKRLLADPGMSHLTILEILLEAGFNSKSSFQRFFKRLTGISPTEFREQALAAAKPGISSKS